MCRNGQLKHEGKWHYSDRTWFLNPVDNCKYRLRCTPPTHTISAEANTKPQFCLQLVHTGWILHVQNSIKVCSVFFRQMQDSWPIGSYLCRHCTAYRAVVCRHCGGMQCTPPPQMLRLGPFNTKSNFYTGSKTQTLFGLAFYFVEKRSALNLLIRRISFMLLRCKASLGQGWKSTGSDASLRHPLSPCQLFFPLANPLLLLTDAAILKSNRLPSWI